MSPCSSYELHEMWSTQTHGVVNKGEKVKFRHKHKYNQHANLVAF